ncbi:MAG: GDSL-type esterase/lipase family protein [Acidobacteriota bacterium]
MRRLFLLLILAGAGACGSTPVSPTPPPVGDPAITCPANVTVGSAQPTAVVTYSAPTTSGGTQPTTASCSVLSGTTLPLGTTVVTCTARDAIGRTAACSFSITVTLKVYLRYTRFMAFGDSVTRGEVTTPGVAAFSPRAIDPVNNYPNVLLGLLSARYTSQAFAVNNQGVQGETASEGAARLPSVLSEGPVPEVLLLLEGYNDLPSHDGEIIGSIVTSLAADIETARSRGVKSVMLATLPPLRDGSLGTGLLYYLPPVNAQIRTLAAQKAPFVTLVDLNVAMAGQEATLIGVDGLHPTVAGYKKMAETFRDVLQAAFELPSPPSGLFSFIR